LPPSTALSLPVLVSLHRSVALLYLLSFPTRRSSDLHVYVTLIRNPDGGPLKVLVEITLEYTEGFLDNKDAYDDRMYASLLSRKRSEEHTSELQSPYDLVCRLRLEKKKI